MAVPQLDPRINTDRIYQYADYAALSGTFRRRKSRAWYQYIPPFNSISQRAIRLLPYKIALVMGFVVLGLSVGAMAFFSADTAKLKYQEQDLRASLAGLNQSASEAVGANMERESAVLAGGKPSSAEVVYPAQVKFVTLTNIPDPSGKQLVEQLYPLSRKIIKVAP